LAVRIRLTRIGATKRPAYRVIAIDRRRPRDGRALEILGFYDPLTDPATVSLDTEKINAWIGKGAQPSETVVKLMRQAAQPPKPPSEEKPKRATRAKPKATKAAKADADDTPRATAEATTESPTEVEAPETSEAEAAPVASDAPSTDEATGADEPSADAERADA